MKNAPVNPLSAEFLYELYAAALRRRVGDLGHLLHQQ